MFQIPHHRQEDRGTNPEADSSNSSNSTIRRGGDLGRTIRRRSGMRSAGTIPSSTLSPGPEIGGPSILEEGMAVETKDREGGEEGPHTTGMDSHNLQIWILEPSCAYCL